MLQQTQVSTVVPYFVRFTQAYPNIAALAAASDDDVFRLWEGLGYYRRAHHLLQAARLLVKNNQGRFPREPAFVEALPGIGRYTMGAILSQAFDQRLPILEANSQRVLCRLLGRKDDPRRGETRRWLWAAAEKLLPRRQIGQFNQALMELGALVCTSTVPRCTLCPVRRHCRADKLGLSEAIPLRPKRRKPIYVEEVALIIRRKARVLLLRRPPRGRWAGLWEFPHAPTRSGQCDEESLLRQIKMLTGFSAVFGKKLLSLRHNLTHHRILLTGFEARYKSGVFSSSFYTSHVWVEPMRITDYAVSTPQRRLAKRLLS
jgi:A/G-specific adenine glycosylase